MQTFELTIDFDQLLSDYRSEYPTVPNFEGASAQEIESYELNTSPEAHAFNIYAQAIADKIYETDIGQSLPASLRPRVLLTDERDYAYVTAHQEQPIIVIGRPLLRRIINTPDINFEDALAGAIYHEFGHILIASKLKRLVSTGEESSADFIAAELCAKTGYDWHIFSKLFKEFSDEYDMVGDGIFSSHASIHPSSAVRSKLIEDFMAGLTIQTGTVYEHSPRPLNLDTISSALATKKRISFFDYFLEDYGLTQENEKERLETLKKTRHVYQQLQSGGYTTLAPKWNKDYWLSFRDAIHSFSETINKEKEQDLSVSDWEDTLSHIDDQINFAVSQSDPDNLNISSLLRARSELFTQARSHFDNIDISLVDTIMPSGEPWTALHQKLGEFLNGVSGSQSIELAKTALDEFEKLSEENLIPSNYVMQNILIRDREQVVKKLLEKYADPISKSEGYPVAKLLYCLGLQGEIIQPGRLPESSIQQLGTEYEAGELRNYFAIGTIIYSAEAEKRFKSSANDNNEVKKSPMAAFIEQNESLLSPNAYYGFNQSKHLEAAKLLTENWKQQLTSQPEYTDKLAQFLLKNLIKGNYDLPTDHPYVVFCQNLNCDPVLKIQLLGRLGHPVTDWPENKDEVFKSALKAKPSFALMPFVLDYTTKQLKDLSKGDATANTESIIDGLVTVHSLLRQHEIARMGTKLQKAYAKGYGKLQDNLGFVRDVRFDRSKIMSIITKNYPEFGSSEADKTFFFWERIIPAISLGTNVFQATLSKEIKFCISESLSIRNRDRLPTTISLRNDYLIPAEELGSYVADSASTQFSLISKSHTGAAAVSIYQLFLKMQVVTAPSDIQAMGLSLRQRLESCSEAERVIALKQLLATKDHRDEQLTDVDLRRWACSHFAELLGKDLGIDNSSEEYQKEFVEKVINGMGDFSQRDKAEILPVIADVVIAQRQVSSACKEAYKANFDIMTVAGSLVLKSADLGLEVFQEIPDNGASLLKFLLRPFTSESCREFGEELYENCDRIRLDKKVGIIAIDAQEAMQHRYGIAAESQVTNEFDEDVEQADIDAFQTLVKDLTLIYRQFWDLPLIGRSETANLLLVSPKAQARDREQAQAIATSVVLTQLYPFSPDMDASQKQLTRILRRGLECFLEACPDYMRNAVMGSLLAAAEPGNAVRKRDEQAMAENTAQLLGVMGPAFRILGQQIAIDPNVPPVWAGPMAEVQSQTSKPKRWDIFDEIDRRLPEDDIANIIYVGPVKGAASFNVSVPLQFSQPIANTSFTETMLTYLRPHADSQAKFGFDVIERTSNQLLEEVPALRPNKAAIDSIIDQSRRRATKETNYPETYKASLRAAEIYNGCQVQCDGLKVNYSVMPWLQYGNGYRYTITAPGEHLYVGEKANVFSMQQATSLAKAEALLELRNIFSGNYFDHDRHDGQSRYNKTEAAVYSAGLFDHGGMRDVQPTPSERGQLKEVLLATATTAGNVIQWPHVMLEACKDWELQHNNRPDFTFEATQALRVVGARLARLSPNDLQEVFAELIAGDHIHPDYKPVISQLVQDKSGLKLSYPIIKARAKALRGDLRLTQNGIAQPAITAIYKARTQPAPINGSVILSNLPTDKAGAPSP